MLQLNTKERRNPLFCKDGKVACFFVIIRRCSAILKDTIQKKTLKCLLKNAKKDDY